jgi:hypothetical protein
MNIDIESIVLKHLAYCRANDWAGIDPYDALNSRLLKALPFLDSRLPRIAMTQALKRSPINIRPLLGIEKTQNPKALACFLSASLKLANLPTADREDHAGYMIERLKDLRSPGVPYWCWGYSFPWQTRTKLVPKLFPNLVCTSFVAGALLDAYEQRRDSRCLDMAVSAGDYIVNDLYWTEGASCAGFAYPLPSWRQRIPNANFLAAALLCRVYRHTGDRKYLDPALTAARYSAVQQRADGGWDYGEAPSQRWIDNFHTGYNLDALRDIGRHAETTEFEGRIRRGLDFYKDHFFLANGSVKYFHDRVYPIDAHCVAQSIITLLALKDLEPDNVPLAHSVFQWAMDNLWDERGFFYYRRLRFLTIRTSYMRWTQAWMFLALVTLLESGTKAGQPQRLRESTSVDAAV